MLIIPVLLFSCLEDKVLNKPIKKKSYEISDSIVLKVTNINGNYVFPDTCFTHHVYIKSIKVHYNEQHTIGTTQRIFQISLLNSSQDTVLYQDSVSSNYALQGYIQGTVFEDQTIIYDDLNIMCDRILLYAQVNTNKTFTATIYTMEEPDTINEVVSFVLPQNYEVNTYPSPVVSLFKFNSDVLVKNIKVQHWGKLSRSFTINQLNISDVSSFLSVKDYSLNSTIDSLNISMQSVPPLPYSAAGYLNYGDITFVATISKN